MEWTEETIVRLRALWDRRAIRPPRSVAVWASRRMPWSARRTGWICRRGRRRSGATACLAARRAIRAAPGGRPDPAAAFQHRVRSPRSGGSAAAPHVAMLAPKPSPVAPVVRVAPPAPRPYGRVGDLLLADRRARHPQLPFLRLFVRTGEAVLLGAREACLREGARPARRRRLTSPAPSPAKRGGSRRGEPYSRAASRIARGVAAINWSCDAGRSARIKP